MCCKQLQGALMPQSWGALSESAYANTQDLSLAGNCLDSLPPQLGQLTNLKRLGLAGNRLRELPDTLGQLCQLEGLWLHGNLLQVCVCVYSSGMPACVRVHAFMCGCG